MSIKKLAPNQDGCPRCRISWYIGARKIVRVLSVDFETAKKILQQKLAERDLSSWGQTVPKLYPDAAAEFVVEKREANCRDGYVEELERVLVKVLGSRWKSKVLSEISPAMIRDYLRDRQKEDMVSAQTVKKDRAMIGCLFSWAMCRDYCLRNPIESVECPKVDRQAPHFLSPAEFRSLFLASPDALQRAISALVATGARAEELCALGSHSVRSGMVLFEGRKCRDFLHLPVNESLSRLLLGLVDCGWTPAKLRDGIKRAGARAKLPDGLTTHWLRHTAATWMICAGIPVWDVKITLGHASVQTTERYAHVANIDWTQEQSYLPAILQDCLTWLPNKAGPDQTASGPVTLPA
jgi:site-specific recombinase XerD